MPSDDQNPLFVAVFKILQICHHLSRIGPPGAEIELPASFKKATDDLLTLFNPANPHDGIRSRLFHQTRLFFHSVISTFRGHYFHSILILANSIHQCNPWQLREAIRIAELKFKHKHRKVSPACLNLFHTITKFTQKHDYHGLKNHLNSLVGQSFHKGHPDPSNTKTKTPPGKPTTSTNQKPHHTTTPTRTFHRHFPSLFDPTQPKSNIQGAKHPLSNFHPCNIRYRNQGFRSSEHAYQYSKAIHMGDNRSAQAILQAPSAYLAKSIGSHLTQNANTNQIKSWDSTKLKIMWDILTHKINQSSSFKNNLLETGTKQLTHDLPDAFWGSSFQGRRHFLVQQDWFAKLLMALRQDHRNQKTTQEEAHGQQTNIPGMPPQDPPSASKDTSTPRQQPDTRPPPAHRRQAPKYRPRTTRPQEPKPQRSPRIRLHKPKNPASPPSPPNPPQKPTREAKTPETRRPPPMQANTPQPETNTTPPRGDPPVTPTTRLKSPTTTRQPPETTTTPQTEANHAPTSGDHPTSPTPQQRSPTRARASPDTSRVSQPETNPTPPPAGQTHATTHQKSPTTRGQSPEANTTPNPEANHTPSPRGQHETSTTQQKSPTTGSQSPQAQTKASTTEANAPKTSEQPSQPSANTREASPTTQTPKTTRGSQTPPQTPPPAVNPNQGSHQPTREASHTPPDSPRSPTPPSPPDHAQPQETSTPETIKKKPHPETTRSPSATHQMSPGTESYLSEDYPDVASLWSSSDLSSGALNRLLLLDTTQDTAISQPAGPSADTPLSATQHLRNMSDLNWAQSRFNAERYQALDNDIALGESATSPPPRLQPRSLNFQSPEATTNNILNATASPTTEDIQGPHRYYFKKVRGQPWTLPTISASLLVVGDSNINRIEHTTPQMDIQLVSYSGAKLTHFITNPIFGYPHQGVRDVIFSCGINSQFMNDQTIEDQFKKIIQKLKKSFPKANLYIPQLNFTNKKPAPIRDTFKRINTILPTLQKFGVKILQPLPQEQFETRADGVHWTTNTAKQLLSSWVQSLN